MEVLSNKILTALAAPLLLLCSCAQEFEVQVDDPQPRICVRGMICPGQNGMFTLQRAVPVGTPKKQNVEFTIRNLSLSCDSEALSLEAEPAPSTVIWADTSPVGVGSHLVIEADFEGLPSIKAETTIPKGLGFAVDSLHTEDGYILYKLEFDSSLKEDSRFAVAVCKKQGEFSDGFPSLMSVSKEGGLLNELTPVFRVVSLPYLGSMDVATGWLFTGMDLGKDKTLEFMVMYDSAWEYTLLVYTLSEEAYGYLNAKYNADNNFLSMLGLAPANFAYSNVSGGYGVLGAYYLEGG